MLFPKKQIFANYVKRLTLRKNQGHFRAQHTKKHKETPKIKIKTKQKICCPVYSRMTVSMFRFAWKILSTLNNGQSHHLSVEEIFMA